MFKESVYLLYNSFQVLMFYNFAIGRQYKTKPVFIILSIHKPINYKLFEIDHKAKIVDKILK